MTLAKRPIKPSIPYVPSPERCQVSQESRWWSRSRWHESRGNWAGGAGQHIRRVPGAYPTRQAWRSSCQCRYRQHSFGTLLEQKPVWQYCELEHKNSNTACDLCRGHCACTLWDSAGVKLLGHTSRKFPPVKTVNKQVWAAARFHKHNHLATLEPTVTAHSWDWDRE